MWVVACHGRWFYKKQTVCFLHSNIRCTLITNPLLNILYSPENERMSPENQWLVQMYVLLKSIVQYCSCIFFDFLNTSPSDCSQESLKEAANVRAFFAEEKAIPGHSRWSQKSMEQRGGFWQPVKHGDAIHHPKGSWGREIPLFQGNLGWWIIWPDRYQKWWFGRMDLILNMAIWGIYVQFRGSKLNV